MFITSTRRVFCKISTSGSWNKKTDDLDVPEVDKNYNKMMEAIMLHLKLGELWGVPLVYVVRHHVMVASHLDMGTFLNLEEMLVKTLIVHLCSNL